MNQKVILCYGDSNTWGYVPLTNQMQQKSRHSRNERWTGLLQILLGSNYYIIEEGLNGRTTNLNYAIPPDRNGKTYLFPCLYSQAPIDLVILGLGGNDMKTYFDRSPEQIKEGLSELVDIIQLSPYGSNMLDPPEILITTSVIPYPFIEDYKDENGIYFLKGVVKKSEELIQLYEQLATEKNCHYLDLSKEAFPSKTDGVHYDLIAHRKVAELINLKIKEIFSN